MKEKINKKNIVKYAGVGLLAGCLSMAICDANFNHLNEYCPLNDILGVNHQIQEINTKYGQDGIKAYYTENGEIQLVSDPKTTIIDGEVYYSAPVGYTIDGGQAVKNIKLADVDEAIVVTKGEPIYPEGEQPGDLIKESDIQVYDPQVWNVITDSRIMKKRL